MGTTHLMSNAARAVLAVALASASLLACSSAPGDESAATQNEAMRNCGMDCPPPPPPPPPPVCSWNPYSVATSGCGTPTPWKSTASVNCVPGNARDKHSTAQKQLISMGCSNPLYWYSYNPGSPSQDWSNAYAQLCPQDWNQITYLANAGRMPGSMTDPHVGYKCDPNFPPAPAGYWWLVTYTDPTCGISGCMCKEW